MDYNCNNCICSFLLFIVFKIKNPFLTGLSVTDIAIYNGIKYYDKHPVWNNTDNFPNYFGNHNKLKRLIKLNYISVMNGAYNKQNHINILKPLPISVVFTPELKKFYLQFPESNYKKVYSFKNVRMAEQLVQLNLFFNFGTMYHRSYVKLSCYKCRPNYLVNKND